jgi:Na+-driven multidrug efflux pump
MGKPLPAVWVSMARMAILYLPLAFIGEHYFGIVGIFGAYALANIGSGAFAYWWAIRSVQEQCDQHAEPVLVSDTL